MWQYLVTSSSCKCGANKEAIGLRCNSHTKLTKALVSFYWVVLIFPCITLRSLFLVNKMNKEIINPPYHCRRHSSSNNNNNNDISKQRKALYSISMLFNWWACALHIFLYIPLLYKSKHFLPIIVSRCENHETGWISLRKYVGQRLNVNRLVCFSFYFIFSWYGLPSFHSSHFTS